MKVLALTHGVNVPPGVFADVVEEQGHRLEEWSLISGAQPPRPLDEYGAVLVFGGSMHADQEHLHPWLREEDALIRDFVERRVPLLGVCLGAQLLAKAVGGHVYRAPEGEVGWFPVELTDAAADDPVVGALPRRFLALDWHLYTWDVPPGAVELARSERYTQALRVGDRAWGVQFHAEVNTAIVRTWLDDSENAPSNREEMAHSLDEHMEDWNRIGRELCGAFLEVASAFDREVLVP